MAAGSRNPRHGALDALLGDRIRTRRRELGFSQSTLGGRLGITFQQVQKYENGSNRVSATMLIKLSEALSLSVSEILNQVDPASRPVDTQGQAAQLMAAFAKIQSADMRSAVLTLVAGLSVR